MAPKNDIKLARLLHYILGRRPDEFGLVPDGMGYVPVKELIKVLQEEKWAHVRPAFLEALPYRLPEAGIEMHERHIRACNRDHLPERALCSTVPKELFTCIRRRAYSAVSRQGLTPWHHPQRVVLFGEREMAIKVGRRRDAEPLVVTVQTTVAKCDEIQFERLGETVYLAARIPTACCRLPAPPRTDRVKHAPNDTPAAKSAPEAGSYTLDWDRLSANDPPTRHASKKSKQWRRERQRLRRMKRNAGDVP